MLTLEKGDTAALLGGGLADSPEVFVAKGRDGKTDIWGIIVRPIQLRSEKEISGDREHLCRTARLVCAEDLQCRCARDQALAELGFIVVQIDGMGTSNRSKAFHDVAWKNLADAGFPDRILWHKAAAAKYPWYDISRVGIFGDSAGGQSSLGSVAVSSRVLQSGGVQQRMPRQPHGQDVVERAVDGLAGRAAVCASRPTWTMHIGCRASC